jgi:hypothetical protein
LLLSSFPMVSPLLPPPAASELPPFPLVFTYATSVASFHEPSPPVEENSIRKFGASVCSCLLFQRFPLLPPTPAFGLFPFPLVFRHATSVASYCKPYPPVERKFHYRVWSICLLLFSFPMVSPLLPPPSASELPPFPLSSRMQPVLPVIASPLRQLNENSIREFGAFVCSFLLFLWFPNYCLRLLQSSPPPLSARFMHATQRNATLPWVSSEHLADDLWNSQTD